MSGKQMLPLYACTFVWGTRDSEHFLGMHLCSREQDHRGDHKCGKDGKRQKKRRRRR